MRLLLINPSEGKLQDNYSKKNPYAPLGLAYLAAYVRQKGVEVTIIDAQVEKLSNSKIIDKIKSYRPNVIGMTILTPGRFSAFPIIKDLKKTFPQIPFIAGGCHPTLCAQDLMVHFPEVDYVVRGEGEFTLLELLEYLCSPQKKQLSEIKGVSFRDGTQIIHNLSRESIEDLDSLPFPARDLLPMRLYHSTLRTPVVKDKTLAEGIITSRGCPMKCYYCASSRIESNWRGRSMDNIMEEINIIQNVYKRKNLFIWDDAFTLQMERARDILRRFIQDKINTHFIVHSRSRNLNEELIYLLKEAGCIELRIGAESGSPLILANVAPPRKQTIEDLYQVADWSEKYNLHVVFAFIISHPKETPKDAEQTLDVIRRLKKYKCVDTEYSIMHIFPGTYIEDYARKNNLLPKDFSWSGEYKELEWITAFSGHVPVFLENFDRDAIYSYLAEWKKITGRPIMWVLPQILRNLRSFREVKELLRMIKIYVKTRIS